MSTISSRRFLALVKVWGGTATILFAVAFTLPTTLYDKISNFFTSRDSQISVLKDKSRTAMAAIAALRQEEADHLRTSTTPQDASLVYSNYDFRIYNLTISNIETFNEAADYLQSGDLYGIGSTLSMVGEYDKANGFYEKALAKAKSEEVFERSASTIYREMGSNNARKGDINATRDAFGESLKLLASQSKPGDMSLARDSFVRNKSELASAEIHIGNLGCGLRMAESILPEMRRLLNAGDLMMKLAIPALEKDLSDHNGSSQKPASDCLATPD